MDLHLGVFAMAVQLEKLLDPRLLSKCVCHGDGSIYIDFSEFRQNKRDKKSFSLISCLFFAFFFLYVITIVATKSKITKPLAHEPSSVENTTMVPSMVKNGMMLVRER